MSNVFSLNRERAIREASTDARYREARADLARWVDAYADLGTPFLIEALRGARNAVEVFEDMMRE